MMRRKAVLGGFVIGLAIGLCLVPVLALPGPGNDSIAGMFGLHNKELWDAEFFVPLGQSIKLLETGYVEEVDPEKLFVGAIQGVLSDLDDYSVYWPPDMFREFRDDTKGEFGGLGIQIQFLLPQKILRVEQPIPGTPAFRAGVLAGDVITRIREGESREVIETSTFKTVHDAVRVLRGTVGTNVTITVVHKATGEAEEITITRAIIKVPGVRAVRIINPKWKIGYVFLAHFHEATVSDLDAALEELKRQGARALILDLRFNPGGLLQSAVDVSDRFLSRGVIVSTSGRAEPQQVFRAEKGDGFESAPLVVLVNRFSASASEIVAAAVKDNGRGLIIGEPTFGKGSVQKVFRVPRRNSAIKLTTARYYTPSGECIEKGGADRPGLLTPGDETLPPEAKKGGVRPHVEIMLTNEEIKGLNRKLADETEFPPKPKQETQPEQGAPGTETPEGDAEKPEPFRDVQLERAVDILIGMLIEQNNELIATEAAAD